MTDPLKPAFQKTIGPQAETLVIRVMAPDASGAKFHPMTFEKDRVDYVMELGFGLSAIALKNGVKIPVLMGYEELEKKIYFADLRDQPVLDLRGVTGEPAGKAQIPDLSADAPPAETEKTPETKTGFVDRPLAIAVFARQPEQQNFVMFTFKDTDVNWSGVDGEDGRNGKLTRVPFNLLKGPFGGREIIFDLPRPAFMELYNKAKMDGAEELDLRELTRRRDPDKTLQKMAAKSRPPMPGGGGF
jgi:hypothetical protein